MQEAGQPRFAASGPADPRPSSKERKKKRETDRTGRGGLQRAATPDWAGTVVSLGEKQALLALLALQWRHGEDPRTRGAPVRGNGTSN